MSPDERVRVTRGILESDAVVTHGDRECGRLFGKRGPVNDVPFKELLARWQQDFPDSNAEWVDAISSQICSAALEERSSMSSSSQHERHMRRCIELARRLGNT